MNDADLLWPQHLTDFIGQDEVKERLEKWIDWAKGSNRALPHVIMTSQAGMGKTSLALVISNELNVMLQVVDLSKVASGKLANILNNFEEGVLLLDEVHTASKRQQEELLQLAEEGWFVTAWGERYDRSRLTLVAATTKPEKVEPAFRDRFTIELRLSPYSLQDLTTIVTSMAGRLGVTMPPEHAEALAGACAGSPRTARKLVLGYRALGGDATVEDTLRLLDREPDGLTHDHVRYLHALRDFGGQLGEKPLSTILRMHTSVVSDLERTLLDRRMIRLTPGGRVLTARGVERVRQVGDGSSRELPRCRQTEVQLLDGTEQVPNFFDFATHNGK